MEPFSFVLSVQIWLGIKVIDAVIFSLDILRRWKVGEDTVIHPGEDVSC